jgi:hypothetical protein
MMAFKPTPKKLSYKDLERKAKSYLNATNAVMDRMVDKLAMERLHAEIHMEVNRLVAEGEMSKHELFQWRLKWEDVRKNQNVPPEKLAEYLQLPNLRSNYLGIYHATSQEVGDELTAFYLGLEG